MRLSILGFLVLIIGSLMSQTASAQTKWVMATPYADGNFHTLNLRQFAYEVRSESKGALDIMIKSNQSLLRMPEILRGVQTGQAQMGEFLISAYSNEDPFFEIDSIPYVSNGYETARKVWELSRPYVEARMKKRQVIPLYSAPWPSQGIYTKAEVSTLAELKGSKFRAYNAATTRFAQLIEATPTTVQSAEVPAAFASGLIDSMMTSAQTGVDTQVWDFAKFYIHAEIMNVKNLVVVNEAAFNGLPPELQTIIKNAAARAESRGWEMSSRAETSAMDKLKKHDVKVSRPSEPLIAELTRIRDIMVKEWLEKAGDDGKAVITALGLIK